ncbi:hypothetical protein RND71_039256 [Anisodus tanguticus]|uniref:GAG-pre-integrase domain-containing protein n=1 Tax=Anisodus tanguticus TaxID=243964 RepID=A0AAE1QWA5_9SOLA|nr:hypothetical protein RND71_039256 [Anisodus tanguticus]
MCLMRCDSRGELYPTTTTTHRATLPSIFVALAPSLWHERLGHMGVPVFASLKLNKFIECTRTRNSHVCRSCSLEKHVKLPFVASNSCTIMPFDIIHNDI